MISMKRRDFLKKAGIGSAALASIPTLASSLATPAFAHLPGLRPFFFVAFSAAGTVGGVEHRIAVNGAGRFLVRSGIVSGIANGTFVHFDNAPPAPKPVLSTGTWNAVRFTNFRTGFGKWGVVDAGILDLNVELTVLQSSLGLPLGTVLPAKLHYVCNIGTAGITTGEPEGYSLEIPGTPFATGGAVGPFKALVPPVGVTNISIPQD